MKQSARLASLFQQGMIESMGVDLMVALVRAVISNYDINKRTGIPDSIPINKKDAANQINRDIKEDGLMLEFANLLVKTHMEGYMGRPLQISCIREIIREMFNLGYLYDPEYKMFIENSEVQRTPNWGVLKDNTEYQFTFLRLDIAGNSAIVRDNPAHAVEAAYGELRRIVESAIERRNGRIWSWEGDGVLAAFYFSKNNSNASLAGIEILHELFIFNTMRCSLSSPLNVRIAVHTGQCIYTNNIELIKKNETIKKIIELESKFTPLNSLTISGTTGQHFNDVLLARLEKNASQSTIKYFNYNLTWK
jgi:hypothetical protein